MSEIRVTYSGLIGFVIGLSTVITGMIFLLIITRTLTPTELGTWSLIGGVVTYAILIEPIISYWNTRDIARGKKTGTTAVFSSGIFSVAGMIIYLIIAYFVGISTDADVEVLLFAVIIIPLMFINRTLISINLGWKPHVNSYGLFVFDISKIPAAFIFIYTLEFGVSGAILSLVVAYLASIAVLSKLAMPELRAKIEIKHLKRWLKLGWLPSYIKFPSLVVLDVLVFSLVTGSVFGLAYWIAAITVATLVRHTNEISKAIYPKLLSGGKKEYLQENITIQFYFVFPFIALSIAFARPALFALNPEYEAATLVVVFLTLRTFLNNFSHTLINALQGIEKVDVSENSTIKHYLKSMLFRIPTIRLIQRGIYLGMLGIGLLIMISIDSSQLDLVIFWSIIAMVIQIPFTIYFFFKVRKEFPLKVDRVAILKYLAISIFVFGMVYLLVEEFLEYKVSIFEFLPNLLLFIILGILLYGIFTFLADHNTRKLVTSVLTELRGKRHSNAGN